MASRSCYSYLDERIQGDPGDKPGRAPDLSPGGAAAMRAVVREVGRIVPDKPMSDGSSEPSVFSFSGLLSGAGRFWGGGKPSRTHAKAPTPG